MILDSKGRPVTVTKPDGSTGRRGMQYDLYSLPKGATCSYERSKALHEKIKNNTQLRERIEVADRMTKTQTLHLAMMERNGDMSQGVVDSLEHNMKIAEQVLIKRNSENQKKVVV